MRRLSATTLPAGVAELALRNILEHFTIRLLQKDLKVSENQSEHGNVISSYSGFTTLNVVDVLNWKQ